MLKFNLKIKSYSSLYSREFENYFVLTGLRNLWGSFPSFANRNGASGNSCLILSMQRVFTLSKSSINLELLLINARNQVKIRNLNVGIMDYHRIATLRNYKNTLK